eukprot:2279142-Pyramimonas_sp.AAC.1
MISDLGVEHSLTLTPPSLLQVFLREGVWRSLEREAARKYGPEGVESLYVLMSSRKLCVLRSLRLAKKERPVVAPVKESGPTPAPEQQATKSRIFARCVFSLETRSFIGSMFVLRWRRRGGR